VQAWEVSTLDPVTYEKSKNFLQRWRIYSWLQDTVKNEPNVSGDLRTVEWMIGRYIRDHQKYHRGHKRQARFLSIAEVLHAFAPHAEWLLAQQLSPTVGNKNLLCPHSLYRFCKAVLHRSALMNLDVDLSKYGGEPEHFRKRLDRLRKQYSALPPPVSCLYDTDRYHETFAIIRMQVETRQIQLEHFRPQEQRAGGFHYDPDYSTSESDYSDSDGEQREPGATPKVQSTTREPRLLIGSTVWNCPRCDYKVDFRSLTSVQAETLPVEIRSHVLHRQWETTEDSKLLVGLRHLVINHYRYHK
jgi:hypothetical protein